MSIDRTVWEQAIAEMCQATLQPSAAVSTMEFAALMGLSRGHAYRTLLRLVDAGKAMRTKKQIMRADGGVQWVTAYLLKKSPRGKK